MIEGYRENLAESQRELDIAQTVKDEFKARDMIAWGRTKRGYEGWLCKGEAADRALSNWARAKSDLEHWGSLLNDELRRARPPAVDPRLPPEKDDEEPMTPEQVEAKKADLNSQFEEWQARNATEAP